MTPWQIGETWLCILVFAVAWNRGGHPERLATGLLLLDQLLAMDVTFDWRIEHFYPIAILKGCVLVLVFGWLSVSGRRWWPMVVTAALCLILATYVLRLGNPELSHFAAASARVGLNYLIDLALLLGVLERWLSGEPAASPAAWAKADRLTAARREQRNRSPDTANQPATSGAPRAGQPR